MKGIALALAALAGGTPVVAVRAQQAIADSSSTIALTAGRLTTYIAAQKALGSYWTSADSQTAETGARTIKYEQPLQLTTYDYPALAKQDAAVAAVFTANHVTPEQFGAMHLAAVRAMASLILEQVWGGPFPADSTAAGKNLALVKAHRLELAQIPLIAHIVYLEHEFALTADQVTRYIALKKALRSFWQAPQHAALLAMAATTERHPNFNANEMTFDWISRVNDYPFLVTQDTALAAVFTKNHFAPEEFEATQVAIYQALVVIIHHDKFAGGALKDQPLSGDTPVVDANLALVQPKMQELADAGAVALVPKGDFSMDVVRMDP